MSDKITKVRIKQADGTFGAAIPIGVEGANVSLSSGVTLQDTISSINTKLGSEDISDAGTSVTNAINSLNQSLENTTKMETTYLTNAYTYGGKTQDDYDYLGIEFDRGSSSNDRFRFQINSAGVLNLFQRKADDSGWTVVNTLNINNAITNISRSGKTFTATRGNGTTFTFDQQDTTYGLASTSADGLLRKLDNNTAHYMRGDGTWQTPPNTTYGLASTSANGLLRKLDNNTAHYMRGDGTWQTPPNTNTWRPVQNNLTNSSTTDSLSANMGKTLWDRMNTIGYVLVNGTGTQTITNAWKNVGQVTLTPGTWILFGEARSAASQQGKNYTLRFSVGSYRQTCYIPTTDNASASVADTWTVTANTVVYAQVWSSSVTLESGGMTAIRIRNF